MWTQYEDLDDNQEQNSSMSDALWLVTATTMTTVLVIVSMVLVATWASKQYQYAALVGACIPFAVAPTLYSVKQYLRG